MVKCYVSLLFILLFLQLAQIEYQKLIKLSATLFLVSFVVHRAAAAAVFEPTKIIKD